MICPEYGLRRAIFYKNKFGGPEKNEPVDPFFYLLTLRAARN